MKLLSKQAVSMRFRRFILTVVMSGAALGTVIPLEQWDGGANTAFQISSAFAQSPGGVTLMLNGSTAPITVAPGATLAITVLNPKGNALDWIGIYPRGVSAGTTKSVVEHYVVYTTYTIPATTPAGTYEARLFANDSLTVLATTAPITVSTGTPPPSPAPAVSTLIVNGGSGPITVPGGATVSVGVQNGPGNQWDCVSLNASPDVNAAWLGYAFLTPFSTTGTVTFTMPSAAGTYGVLFWQNCNTLIMIGPTVTVGLLPPTPPPVASPPPPTSGGCQSNCFYVSVSGSDSNPGTQAAPWRTMRHAAATMGPGDTTLVMDGTYEEDIVRFSNQGTAEMRITLKAQHSRMAILASLSPNSCQPSFNVHAGYVTIEGIRVMASPNASQCTTYGSGMAFRFWHNDSYSVSILGRQDTGNIGGVIRDVQVDNSLSFSMSVKTSQDDMLIENSTFYGEVEAFNSNHVVYRNNVIYHGGPNGNYISGKGGVRNLLLYGNVVHLTTVASPASWALGLSCGQVSGPQWDYDPSTGWESYNCAAFNNVILNETGSYSANGMSAQGALDSWFFNNVLLNGAYFQNRTGGAGQQSQNVTLKNNIFSCNGGQAVSSVNPTGYFNVDYNAFFGCAGAPNQAHPILGDPMFVDPASDWHLRPGSPAIGSGVPVTMTGYYGESLDVSRNTDSNIRTEPWNLGIY